MTNTRDRMISNTLAVAVSVFIFSELYRFPSTFVFELPKESLIFVKNLQILSLVFTDGKVILETWHLFFTAIVSLFGVQYLFHSIRKRTQKFNLIGFLCISVLSIICSNILVLTSLMSVLYFVELFSAIFALFLISYLVRNARYRTKYVQYCVYYMVGIFFIVFGASSSTFELNTHIVLFTFLATVLYTALFWLISMTFIFLREIITL